MWPEFLRIWLGMEGLREFLEKIRQQHLVRGNLRALFHVCIGRKIARADGTVLSNGVTWRELSDLLRTIRWDKELVRELGLNPDDLPPRDRQRYWYTAIHAAQVMSPESRELGDEYARRVATLGFVIGPAPGS
jgi:hypothetical protein